MKVRPRRDRRRTTQARPAAPLLWALVSLPGAAALAAPFPGLGGAPQGPVVQLIDTSESGDHTDVSVEFSCSMRYISNTPVSHGSQVTIRLMLGPDCGSSLQTVPPELPLVGGGSHLITGARVDSMLPGEITLELQFARPLDFVMAPTASGLGLRVRLLNTRERRAGVSIEEPRAASEYAVNLESSRKPIARAEVQAAAADLGVQAYVSQTEVGDQAWYRLRVGPFATRAEAERTLQAALARYPRAWVTEADEQGLPAATGAPAAPAVAIAAAGVTDPPLPDAERAQILRKAQVALAQHQFPEAVNLLTQLLRQPEYPQRAEAQELIGLVRERAGQLAEAKAEDQEYLRRYPNGPGAARVSERLRVLAAASLKATTGAVFGAGKPERRTTFAGSASLSYEYARDQTISAGTTSTTNAANAALAYGDFLLRHRGDRYDLTARVDGGYTYNAASVAGTGGGSQDQTTAAYGEVVDRNWGVTARLGRQSLASQGVVGLFDGLYVGYQATRDWQVSVAAGLPAYTNFSSVSGQQKFGTVTTEYNPHHGKWVFDAYAYDQTNDIGTERRSVGLQTRYSAAGRTAVALVDYDVQFKQLNSVTLIGNTSIGKYWVVGFDADHRRSPLLELSNALIGQNATDLRTLQNQFTPSQILQMALDRTATSNTVVISASRPFGERWQFMADVSALELSSTPASFGVTATQSTGLDKNGTLQVSGASLLQSGDLHIFSARYDNSPLSRSTTLSWDGRFRLYGAWRIGPRLSVEQLDDPTLGGRQMLYLPQVRTDWTGRTSIFELTAGYQIVNQQAQLQPLTVTGQIQSSAVDQRSLYVTAAYRVRF